MGSIPSGVVALLRGVQPCHRFLLIWVIFLLVDYVLHLHNNNSIVCSLFQQNIITLPAVTAYWNNAVDNICSAGKKCHLFKVKEISYKIINKFYPAKHYIKKMQKWYFLQLLFLWWLYWNCCPKLLFWSCSFTKTFWLDVLSFIRSNIYNECILFWKDVVLGLIEYEQFKRKLRWPRELNALQRQKTCK